jgi:hypothetical protein
MLENFRIRPDVCAKLFCSKRVSAGTASPFCVWSCHNSRTRAHPATFAGTERHHQIAATLQALSLSHGSDATPTLKISLVTIEHRQTLGRNYSENHGRQPEVLRVERKTKSVQN